MPTELHDAISNTMDLINIFDKAIYGEYHPLHAIPDSLRTKHRFLQITVKNWTPFPIVYRDEYFDSGEYATRPTRIERGTEMVFSVQSNAWMKGVTGGVAFRLQIDGDDSYQEFAVGFCNPQTGTYKTAIIANPASDPKVAYDHACDEGNKITTDDVWTVKGRDGKPVRFKLQFSAYTNREEPFFLALFVPV